MAIKHGVSIDPSSLRESLILTHTNGQVKEDDEETVWESQLYGACAKNSAALPAKRW